MVGEGRCFRPIDTREILGGSRPGNALRAVRMKGGGQGQIGGNHRAGSVLAQHVPGLALVLRRRCIGAGPGAGSRFRQGGCGFERDGAQLSLSAFHAQRVSENPCGRHGAIPKERTPKQSRFRDQAQTNRREVWPLSSQKCHFGQTVHGRRNRVPETTGFRVLMGIRNACAARRLTIVVDLVFPGNAQTRPTQELQP